MKPKDVSMLPGDLPDYHFLPCRILAFGSSGSGFSKSVGRGVTIEG